MLALAFCILIVAADQITKFVIRRSLLPGESVPMLPGCFSVTHVQNTGAAWGMFREFNLGLILFSVVILALLVVYRRRLLDGTVIHKLALGLLAGGILGNLADRVVFSSVTDYLDVYVGRHHWPAFNIADAAICTAVFLYLAATWRAAPASGGAGAAPGNPP